MMTPMDDVIAELAAVGASGEFWLNLGALLTDEVVLAEAQAAGMDWPDLADGRRRLVSTRKVIVHTAEQQGWISGQDATLLVGADPQEVLAAARPWIEREQRRQLADAPSDDR
jgi:hypothetical protein